MAEKDLRLDLPGDYNLDEHENAIALWLVVNPDALKREFIKISIHWLANGAPRSNTWTRPRLVPWAYFKMANSTAKFIAGQILNDTAVHRSKYGNCKITIVRVEFL